MPSVQGIQLGEAALDGMVVAPSRAVGAVPEVEVLARLPGRCAVISDEGVKQKVDPEAGDIVAVRQANVFGTSFHPELTGDPRIHVWWLEQVLKTVNV